jgi:hypothetical protein
MAHARSRSLIALGFVMGLPSTMTMRLNGLGMMKRSQEARQKPWEHAAA